MDPEMTQSLDAKSILLVVGGGIAAYKALETVRRLRARGARVRVVMTAAAKEFVTPLAFVSLSNEKVHDDLFSATDEQEMGHIQLSRAADLIVVAPATAHLMARAAQGLCDDLATTLLLATDKRVLYAPAMNVRMWLAPATQRNVALLKQDGALFVGKIIVSCECSTTAAVCSRRIGKQGREWSDTVRRGMQLNDGFLAVVPVIVVI